MLPFTPITPIPNYNEISPSTDTNDNAIFFVAFIFPPPYIRFIVLYLSVKTAKKTFYKCSFIYSIVELFTLVNTSLRKINIMSVDLQYICYTKPKKKEEEGQRDKFG